MSGFGNAYSQEQQPVTWVRGYPLYTAHVIVAVLVASMLASTVLLATNFGGVLAWLSFSSDAVLRGQIWRVLTYGLNNPPSLWFVIDMFMIVWFGRELERFFGRRVFLTLYGSIYLLTPVLLTLLGFVRPSQLAGQTGAFALFIAVATLHPDLPMLFNLLAKWVAAILVATFALMAVAARDVVGLITLLGTSGFAWAFVRHQQGLLALPKFRLRRRTPKLTVIPGFKTDPAPTAGAAEAPTSMAEIDALLDKIATSGINSLTKQERAKLEAAREGLMKRGGK